MTVDAIEFPAMAFGQFDETPKTIRTVAPTGKFNIVTPKMNYPQDDYYAMGATHLVENTGIANPTAPLDKRGLFLENPFWVRDAFPTRYLPDLSVAEAESIATNFLNGRGKMGALSITSEAYDATYNWRMTDFGYAPAQAEAIERVFGNTLTAEGKLFVGEYGGSCLLLAITEDMYNINPILPGTLDPNQAISIIKRCEGYRPYFSRELYRYSDTCINTYNRGRRPFFNRLYDNILRYQLHNNAMKTVTTPRYRRLISFRMPDGSEFVSMPNYSVDVVGGKLVGNGWKQYSAQLHVTETFTDLLFTDGIWYWDDNMKFGTNPGLLVPDVTLPDFYTRYVGSGAARKQGTYIYDPSGVGMTAKHWSYLGANQLGHLWFNEAIAWTGTTNTRRESEYFTPVAFRKPNGSYMATNGDYYGRNFQAGVGFGVVIGTGNKKYLFAVMAEDGTYDFKVGSETVSTYCFRDTPIRLRLTV